MSVVGEWTESGAAWPEVESAAVGRAFDVRVERVGQTDDIADAVAFICSALVGYVTKVNLRVDGGAMPALWSKEPASPMAGSRGPSRA